MGGWRAAVVLALALAAGGPALAGAPGFTCRGTGNALWHPFSYRAAGNAQAGVGHDVIARAVERAGGRYEAVDLGPWTRAQAALRHGGLDLVVAAVRDRDREAAFLFTRAYAEERVLGITRAGLDLGAGLEGGGLAGVGLDQAGPGGLKGRRVILSRGVSYGDAWEAAVAGLELVPAPTAEEGLRMLAAGRGELLALAAGAAERLLAAQPTPPSTPQPARFEVLPAPLAIVPVQAMLRPGTPCAAALPAIDAALEDMERRGETDLILATHRDSAAWGQ